MESLYLIDGSNLLFRAYHALPPMATSSGMPTGAVFGLLNMLLRLDENHHPSHIAVVFDAGGKSVRADLYEQYKANRPPCPEDLSTQFDIARRLVSVLGFIVLDGVDGEADDVIATLAQKAKKQGLQVVIVSSDKDLMQLCDDQITLLDTMKNDGQGVTYGPREVEEKFGVPPKQLGAVLALMGDASDNIPGVPGIGPKTASQLIQAFGSIENLLEHIDQIQTRGAEKIKLALREHEKQLQLSQQLVKLHDEMRLEVEVDGLVRKQPNMEELRKILQELEFKRFYRRFFPDEAKKEAFAVASNEDTLFSQKTDPESQPETAENIVTIQPVEVILTKDELEIWMKQLGSPDQITLGISVQHTGVVSEPSARTTPLCGIAFFAQGLQRRIKPIYIPLQHLYLGAPAQGKMEDFVSVLNPLLDDPHCRKIVYGVKDAYLALEKIGLPLHGVVSDPALCSYLLDAGAKHDLMSLVQRYLKVEGSLPKTKEELCRNQRRIVPLESFEIEQVAKIAGFEAEVIVKLGILLREQLSVDSRRLLDQMEIPLGHVLAKIERHGILIDVSVLHQLSEEIGKQLQALEAEVVLEAGYEMNMNSPKQLQELLFEKLKLPGVKKTKTGLSTDAEVLEILANQHPIAKKILTHRTLAKLKNTYLDQLPQLVDPKTGRLHTSYSQIVAATGRLSSSEPNLQNIPIRTEMGTKIRRAFVAPKGMVLIAADYSQIELRVLAHLSKDPLLLQSFLHHEDVHKRTALEMFGPVEGSRPEMRRVAKMINFGIIYGLTDFGLAARLSIPRDVAKKYIQEYFVRYQGVAEFMTILVEKARKEGGARTELGRFRPLPELSASNYQVRAYGERMAKNTPIQGTAADILKLAMIQVQQELERNEKLGAKMLLTVHDELVFEAPIEKKEEVMALVKPIMEQAHFLSVPLEVGLCVGPNWAECK